MACPCCEKCKCQDGTQPSQSGFGVAPVTECSKLQYACVEYTYVGTDCNQSVVGVSFYSADQGEADFRPCAEQVRVILASQPASPCGSQFGEIFRIFGKYNCTTVEYDSQCNCTATDCDLVDIVGEWSSSWGLNITCDCELDLLSYTIKDNGDDQCP